ncbi:unnamed protein product [Linum trigynum]|uniref:Uncharacterized protein n=1 Tax=Linum trigynum TaxID=586398 RepID=A0AAV2CSN5_9ROSI
MKSLIRAGGRPNVDRAERRRGRTGGVGGVDWAVAVDEDPEEALEGLDDAEWEEDPDVLDAPYEESRLVEPDEEEGLPCPEAVGEVGSPWVPELVELESVVSSRGIEGVVSKLGQFCRKAKVSAVLASVGDE